MRIAVVGNERAGGGVSPADVHRLLEEAGAEVRPFDVEELDAAAAAQPDRLAVAGGDGTVAAGAAAAASARIPLAVVPVGTANDFARALGIPLDVEEACVVAAQSERSRRVDLGWMDERPFLNAASIGLAPQAARRAASAKERLGRFAYVLGGLRAALGGEAVECGVASDGETVFEGRAWQVIVSNSGAFGGGSSVGEADPADGLVDVTVIPAEGRLRLVADGVLLRTGRIGRRRGVRQRRAAAATLTVPEGTSFNVDGELVRAGTSRFRAERGALEVVVP